MKLFGFLNQKQKAISIERYQMITDERNGFFAWDGNLYKSDIIRSAIRPKVRAIGKAVAKHIRDNESGLKVNPEPYMRFLLEEPNPLMSMQQLLERATTQLELNNNAFIYIERDEYGYPVGLYPLNVQFVEALKNKNGQLYYRFMLKTGKQVTFLFTDVIHLAKDFNSSDLFGDSNAEALAGLMEIVNTTDQGIVKAIKNSNIVRWLLKFTSTLRPEDMKAQTKQFVQDFLSGDSETVGAAATDGKFDAKQIDPKDYVPNEGQMDKSVQRILSYYNTNEKIVQSKQSEDEWISYYETSVEPDVIQIAKAFTRSLFTRKERAHGNRIVLETSNLTFASMKTKLNLVQFVDRGIFNPNEVRAILNYAPVESGEIYIRRLDTAPTSSTVEGGEKE